MQKVIVTIEIHENTTMFKVDEADIANICEDSARKGLYSGRVYGFSGFDGCCNDKSYPYALEFVSDVIEKRFANLGMSVEFK